MYRLTVSLLAFFGALTLPHGSGRADPTSTKPAARAESVAPESNGEAPPKRDEKGRESGEAAAGTSKKASDPDGSGKAGTANKKGGAASVKNPASSTSKGMVGPKGAAAWTRGQPGVVKLVRG